ncbi:HlyD family efflux transporter periplasmic adaptor subunit [Chitinophaga pendula]|uniref:HlyD family secretion protein n=1 Tax=Chitinophaga TaxID=79328 RepID=UPI000BAEF6EF|nr:MULTISPECIES: HlyD family efflux transporter periplasmic adaptor subunit [Chitinophaga]ASZ13777.1 HlyD family secretion protein [Chitinophaga sp. MD30]UCJ08603.1 HlyD family efflux transporter periplasmic adaptor subunit [Chitinophaga pendula]
MYTNKHKPVILTATGLLIGLLFSACNNNGAHADAYGNFEAVEVIVGAEGTGKLKQFAVEEGKQLAAGEEVGRIDATQLSLKKEQLRANIQAVLSKRPDAEPQLQVIREQIVTQRREQQRISNLVKLSAATTKQLDDINAQIVLLEKQYASLQSQLRTQLMGLSAETHPLQAQIAQLDDQLQQSRVVNPVNGTVLTRYAEQGEIVSYGKALYKIADLSSLLLRAYIGEEQLGSVKIGQTVTVRTDLPEGKYKEWPGTVTWISAEAEFTPKVIQTKEERTNLVYAMKVKVKNDGSLKLGMPGEVILQKK